MSFTMAPISHYVYLRTTPEPEVPRKLESELKREEQKAKGKARERQKAQQGRARAKEAHPQSRKMPRQPRARVQIRSRGIIALYGVLLPAPTHGASVETRNPGMIPVLLPPPTHRLVMTTDGFGRTTQGITFGKRSEHGRPQ